MTLNAEEAITVKVTIDFLNQMAGASYAEELLKGVVFRVAPLFKPETDKIWEGEMSQLRVGVVCGWKAYQFCNWAHVHAWVR